MHDAGAMRGNERAADVYGDRKRFGERDRAGAQETFSKRLTFQILENEEFVLAFASDVEQGADVRMLERRDRARLALEALAQLRVGGERIGQDLDRDRAIE